MSGLVKEWKKTKRPEDRGSYWFSPANHLDWKAQGGSSEIQALAPSSVFPNSGSFVWRKWQCIIIRERCGCSGCRCARQGTATSDGGTARRWRWHVYASTLISIIALLIICITGCQDKRASLEKQYAEARLLFQQGYIDQPLPLAEAGYRDINKVPGSELEISRSHRGSPQSQETICCGS